MRRRVIPVLLFVGLSTMLISRASSEEPTKVQWATQDASGAKVEVPILGRATIIAFVRTDQKQSQDVLDSIRSSADSGRAQVIVVVSGAAAQEQAKALGAKAEHWPVVVDSDFAASGKMGVHVWPTTLVIGTDGTQLAHLGGVSPSFATDLAAYLEFAAQKLDRAGLEKRLTTRQVVQENDAQILTRKLDVAQRLIDVGDLDQARTQVDQALKMDPANPRARLLLARVMLISGDAKAALKAVEEIPATAAPAWQLELIRTKAYIALDRWHEAQASATDALKQNPEPAEAHYLQGLVYQHEQDWQHAAEEFRRAYECKVSRGLSPEPRQ
jgi:tetratricopeptide (TPR) repeat protein